MSKVVVYFLFLNLLQVILLVSPLVYAGEQKATIDFRSTSNSLIKNKIQVSAIGRCSDGKPSEKYNLIVKLQDQFSAANKSDVYVQLNGGAYLHGDNYSLKRGVLVVKSLKSSQNYNVTFFSRLYGAQSEIKGFSKFECPYGSKNKEAVETEITENPDIIPGDVLNILDVMLTSIDSQTTANALVTSEYTSSTLEVSDDGLTSYHFENAVLGDARVAFSPSGLAGVVQTRLEPLVVQHLYRNHPFYGQVLETTVQETYSGAIHYTSFDITPYNSIFSPDYEFLSLDDLSDLVIQQEFIPGPVGWVDPNPTLREISYSPNGDSIESNYPSGYANNSLGIFAPYYLVNTLGVDVEIPGNDLSNFGSVLNSPSVSVDETDGEQSFWSSFVSYFAPNNNGPVVHGGGNPLPARSSLFLVSSTATSVTLKWSATNTTGSNEKWLYRDDVRVASFTGHGDTITDSGLQPGTVYVYRLKVYNSEGTAVSSPVSVETFNPYGGLIVGNTYRFDEINLTFSGNSVCRHKNSSRSLDRLINLGNMDPNQLAIAKYRDDIRPFAASMFETERLTGVKIVCGNNLPNPFTLTNSENIRPGNIYRYGGINVKFDGVKVCLFHQTTLNTPNLINTDDYNPNQVHLTLFREQLSPLFDKMWQLPAKDRKCS